MRSTSAAYLASATFSVLALAKTDLSGCTSTDVSSPAGASVAWYVPGTYELCDPLDCGGGRAPPKTTVPGCPAYSGTATYSPSYLAGYGPDATATPSASAAADTSSAAAVTTSASSSVDWSALETGTAESSFDLYTTDASASASSSVAAAITSASTGLSSAPTTSGAANNLVVSSTTAAGAVSNGTLATGRPGGNGTFGNSTGSPTSTSSVAGAAETARAWAASAGLVLGLGALVAAL